MDVQALAFDTGGTVLDWHGGIDKAFAMAGQRHGVERDWHAVTNDYRRAAMKAIVGQLQPAFNMDDVHRTELDARQVQPPRLNRLTRNSRASGFTR